jgi:sugar O-acyltransferase (sialic acid O-acetyltransferase NeuD family)
VNLPVIIVGGGGHAKVLLDVLCCMSSTVLGYLAPTESEDGCDGIEYLGNDEAVSNYSPESIRLVNGVGSVDSQDYRTHVFCRFKEIGYGFATVIHPSAIIASDVRLNEGCQVMAGAVLQPGVCCDENVIINTRAGIDHDCHIGAHSHISVGATLSGGISVGCQTHIGAGSTIIQEVSVGERCIIAAGAVVTHNVPDGATVVGVPARRIQK